MPPAIKTGKKGQMTRNEISNGNSYSIGVSTSRISCTSQVAMLEMTWIKDSVSWFERRRNVLGLGAIPASKDLELHFEILHVKSNQSPLLRKIKPSKVINVSLGVKAEFTAELMNELSINCTLIENWHHERPVIKVQNEVADEAEEKFDHSRLQENQAGI
ncbi:hypothetical protein L207DRAFT_508283 [Hyaloscypha variabilis F]|uniref:Uncharacterized protein n=1 Tax=Hyaloscypha variabilis (strain UAMH 11265 / GT02V1 / F) TaxID=1149755 RepID=A0A2J6S3M9_HYAVF|nr:hypothetical protein L207DRAFT_508283 [Hyaloscypha variabilis F]